MREERGEVKGGGHTINSFKTSSTSPSFHSKPFRLFNFVFCSAYVIANLF